MTERRSKKFEGTFYGDEIEYVKRLQAASGIKHESDFIRHLVFASAALPEIATREEISRLGMVANRLERHAQNGRGGSCLKEAVKLIKKLVKDLQKRIRERAQR